MFRFIISAALIWSYIFLLGGTAFYEKIDSPAVKVAFEQLSPYGAIQINEEVLQDAALSMLSGKSSSLQEAMPAVIFDPGLAAVKVGDSYAGVYFRKEDSKIDIEILRDARIAATLIGAFALSAIAKTIL